MGKPLREIVHENHSGITVAAPDIPRDGELAFGIEPNPRPDIASAFRSGLRGRHVLLLGIAKGPRLIGLNASTRQVHNCTTTARRNGWTSCLLSTNNGRPAIDVRLCAPVPTARSAASNNAEDL